MRILIIDDERTEELALTIAKERSRLFRESDLSGAEIKIIRTYDEAFLECGKGILYDFLLLDHDLGSSDVYDDGTRLMNVLEELAVVSDWYLANHIIAISSNPTGVQKINLIAARLEMIKDRE